MGKIGMEPGRIEKTFACGAKTRLAAVSLRRPIYLMGLSYLDTSDRLQPSPRVDFGL
jgi:hypothetical protein